MKPVSENIRLLKRAYWLIKLRWIAIVFVGAATYVSSNFLEIELQDAALYSIAILLALYNITIFLLLNHHAKKGNEVSQAAVKKIINIQISTDLLILTVLLHFSGGIENPFVFYFIFHMIIASILLSFSLLNAIRYTPEKGTVTIDAKNGKDCAVIEMADTGIGIPADEINDVFDEFFRARNARKVHRDGTGLGLSIAKYIVERHGGKMWVDSIKDTGTKFWITLPKGVQQNQAT